MDILLRVWIVALLCCANVGYAQSWTWAQAALSSGSEAATGIAVRPADGSVLTCGVFNRPITNLPGIPTPNISGIDNGLITVQDSGGTFLGHTVIRSDNPLTLNDISCDALGNAYVTGSFSGTADFSGNGGTALTAFTPRSRSLFLLKLNPLLQGVWVKVDTQANFSEGKALAVYFNQILVSGNYQGDFGIDSLQLPTSNDTDALAIRVDAMTAAVIWMKEISGPGVEISDAIAVNFGNVFVGGHFSSDTLPFSNTGFLLPNQNGGSTDIFVVALHADSGNVRWASSAGGLAEEVCHGITVDYDQVYATGSFTGSATFGATGLNAAGGTDAYLWALDRNSGASAWAVQEGGAGIDNGEAVDVDEIGNVVWIGEFNGTVLFNGGVSLAAIGNNGIFCTSYRANGSPHNWAVEAGSSDLAWGRAVEAGQYGTFVAGAYQNSQLNFQGAPSIALSANNFADHFVAAIQCGDLLPIPPVVAANSDSLCIGLTFDIQLLNSSPGIFYGLYDADTDTLIGPLQPGYGGVLNFSSEPLAYSMDFNLVAIDSSGRCQQNLAYYFVQVGAYPVVSLGPDTLFCSGDSVLLRGSGASFFSTSWSNGATSDSIFVSTPGTYWLDVKNIFSCTASDTVVVQELVLPTLQFPDTAACVGSTVTVYNPFPAYTCLWANSTVGDSATFAPGSTVWGELSQSICAERDSFVIALLTPPYVNFGPDTVLCIGANILLDPTDEAGTYQWAGGQTDSTLAVMAAGTYSVSVTGPNGCVGVDQIDITYEAPVSLYVGTTQTSFCASDAALTLLPTPLGGILSGDISGNAIDPSLLSPGNYQAQYAYTSPAGCADSVSLAFLIAPGPTPALAGVDQTLYEGSPVQLAANLPLSGAGVWSSTVPATFGDPSQPVTSVSGLPLGTSDLIWTISTPFCGNSSDTVRITLNPVVALVIPTGFSPNNDGYNDTWDVAGLEIYAQRQLKVFNRWGAAVYENSAWPNAWDARNDGGVELPDDTYYYVLDLGTAQHAGYLVIKR